MKLIVLEGCDGTGTTTHAERLGYALQREGHPVWIYRHPPHRPGAGDWERSLHYARERAEMVSRAEEETLVIADRWVYSTEAIAMTLASEVRGRMLGLTALERGVLPSPILVALLDAPDAVLDERLTDRGESLPPYRGELRRAYRAYIAPMCDVTVSTDRNVREVEASLLKYAREALKGGLR